MQLRLNFVLADLVCNSTQKAVASNFSHCEVILSCIFKYSQLEALAIKVADLIKINILY